MYEYSNVAHIFKKGPAYPSGTPGFTNGFSGVLVAQHLVLCLCFVDRCLSSLLLAIVLSVL